MELLESERRILSPGCCTEEREKKRKGGREEERGRRDRTEDHATCNTTLYFTRGEGQERVWGGGTSDVSTEKNRTWDEGSGDSRRIGGRWVVEEEREVRGWREKQQHRLWTPPERRGGASPRHLLTDNSTNSSQIVVVVVVRVRVCVWGVSTLCCLSGVRATHFIFY